MKGWGPKSSVCPSKPGKSNFWGRDIAGFCRDIPEEPEKFEKIKVRVQFSVPTQGVPRQGRKGKIRSRATPFAQHQRFFPCPPKKRCSFSAISFTKPAAKIGPCGCGTLSFSGVPRNDERSKHNRQERDGRANMETKSL